MSMTGISGLQYGAESSKQIQALHSTKDEPQLSHYAAVHRLLCFFTLASLAEALIACHNCAWKSSVAGVIFPTSWTWA